MKVQISVDCSVAGDFARWLTANGHHASIGTSTGNYIDDDLCSEDEHARDCFNDLWGEYCREHNFNGGNGIMKTRYEQIPGRLGHAPTAEEDMAEIENLVKDIRQGLDARQDHVDITKKIDRVRSLLVWMSMHIQQPEPKPYGKTGHGTPAENVCAPFDADLEEIKDTFNKLYKLVTNPKPYRRPVVICTQRKNK